MDQAIGTGLGFAMFFVVAAGSGLLTGVLARWVLSGPDPMGWLATMGYGLAGSLLGGAVARLVRVPAGIDLLLAIACAALLIWFFRRRGAAKAPGTTPPNPLG